MVRAFAHAFTILGWQENLGEDEMPPEWMWALDEELEEWFEEVQMVRKEKYSTGGSGDETPMMTNALAKDVKR